MKAYIVEVAGFLGVGERFVAVKPSALKLTWDHEDNKWRGEVDTSKQELQSAPQYNTRRDAFVCCYSPAKAPIGQ